MSALAVVGLSLGVVLLSVAGLGAGLMLRGAVLEKTCGGAACAACGKCRRAEEAR